MLTLWGQLRGILTEYHAQWLVRGQATSGQETGCGGRYPIIPSETRCLAGHSQQTPDGSLPIICWRNGFIVEEGSPGTPLHRYSRLPQGHDDAKTGQGTSQDGRTILHPWKRSTPPQTQPGPEEAARLIRGSCYLFAFTNAGISMESGIAPFRGPGAACGASMIRGCWDWTTSWRPNEAWPVIFYDHFGRAHEVLATVGCSMQMISSWPISTLSSKRHLHSRYPITSLACGPRRLTVLTITAANLPLQGFLRPGQSFHEVSVSPAILKHVSVGCGNLLIKA